MLQVLTVKLLTSSEILRTTKHYWVYEVITKYMSQHKVEETQYEDYRVPKCVQSRVDGKFFFDEFWILSTIFPCLVGLLYRSLKS